LIEVYKVPFHVIYFLSFFSLFFRPSFKFLIVILFPFLLLFNYFIFLLYTAIRIFSSIFILLTGIIKHHKMIACFLRKYFNFHSYWKNLEQIITSHIQFKIYFIRTLFMTFLVVDFTNSIMVRLNFRFQNVQIKNSDFKKKLLKTQLNTWQNRSLILNSLQNSTFSKKHSIACNLKKQVFAFLNCNFLKT
jgi:hypothetical protein